jgi:hypothetical protein
MKDTVKDDGAKKLKRGRYEKELRRLQGELCVLQEGGSATRGCG